MMGVGGEDGRRNPLGFFSSTINTLANESSNSKGPRDSGCCYDDWFEGIGQFSLTLPRSVQQPIQWKMGMLILPMTHTQIWAIW